MMKIRNFTYNGFCGSVLDGYASYIGEEFIEWTKNPGIAKIKCSDGQIRLIPSYAIESDEPLPPGPDYKQLKQQVEMLIFGSASSS